MIRPYTPANLHVLLLTCYVTYSMYNTDENLLRNSYIILF